MSDGAVEAKVAEEFKDPKKRERTPHALALGMKFVEAGRDEATGLGHGALRLPYADHLVGDPETGVIHGGCITALLDQTCGMAVGMTVADGRAIATIDLRIDYLRAAKPGATVYARAECYKVTRSDVAFVRAFAYDEDPSDLVAAANGTFMTNTRVTPGSNKGPG